MTREEEAARYDLADSRHTSSIRLDAINVMHSFFYDKSYWAGGAIPKNKLYREEHIKAVMEISVMDAFAIAYYLLDKNPPDGVDIYQDDWDVEFCYEALKKIKTTTPKCNQGGMLLVYLSVCHGIDFLPVLKCLAEIRSVIAQWEKEEEEDAAKEEIELIDDDEVSEDDGSGYEDEDEEEEEM